MKKLYLIIGQLFFMALALSGSAQNFYVQITTIAAPSCTGNNGVYGSTVNGGTAPFSYEWSNATGVIGTNAGISGVPAGLLRLKVTDVTGQVASDTVSGNSFYAGIQSTAANCPASDGTVTLYFYGGTLPFHVQWSNGVTATVPSGSTSTLTGLAAGEQLTVVATDDNGCPFAFYGNGSNGASPVGQVEIGSNAPFTVNATHSPATCTDPDGVANIVVTNGTGPYSYLWHTSPVRTAASETGLVTGSYTVTVTDAQGCYEDYSFYLTNTSGGLSGYVTATDEMCIQQNGAVNLYYSGGQSPHTVTWSDGVTATNTRTNLSAGYYTVQVKDANDCVINKSISVRRLSPIGLSIVNTPADCNNQNGGFDLTPNNGTAPYTYKWSTGATSQDVSGLSLGYYNVTVTDAVGCFAFECRYLNTAANCHGIITGKVFQDDNDNCTYDAGELEIANSVVSSRHSTINYGNWDRTNYNGNYTIDYPFNGTYAVTNRVASPHYISQCPGATQNTSVNAPATSVVNFALKPSAIGADLRTMLVSSPVRPGFTHHYNLYVANVGTELLNTGYVDVLLGDDEVLSAFSVTPAFYDATNHIVRFALSNLRVTDYRIIQFSCSIPPTVLLNTKYTVTATAYPVLGDLVEPDNAWALEQTVVGSYDPNDIQSFKTGELQLGEDTALTYHIRFQNTGTYYAEFVIVHDTLDATLDANTLREVVTSHDVKVRILPGNVAEFAFENIFLQDSTTNEPESHGFITYKINLKEGLTYGDEIKNSAAIYFDYNPPVLTNETSNIIASPNGIIERTGAEQKAWAYPNPAKEVVKFTFDSSVETLEILNAAGQVVSKQNVSGTTVEMNTPASKGFYYYKAMDRAGNTYSGKLVVE